MPLLLVALLGFVEHVVLLLDCEVLSLILRRQLQLRGVDDGLLSAGWKFKSR